MNQKFTVLFALVAFVLAWVASEHLLYFVKSVICISWPALITLSIIEVLLMIHILTDVIDIVFEVESKKVLLRIITQWFTKK